MESIRSFSGFWGWPCDSYIYYLLGYCQPNNPLIIAGEDCRPDTKGMFFISTNGANPYALGKWHDLTQDVPAEVPNLLTPLKNRNPFDMEIDKWGKLEYKFNDIHTSHYETEPLMDNWIKHVTPKSVIDRKNTSVAIHTQNSSNSNKNKRTEQNSREKFMQEYKRNISSGYHPHQVFQVPHINN